MVNQLSGTDFPYTVYDTVMTGRYHNISPGFFGGKPSQADKAAVEEGINAAGLSDIRDRMVNTLSGGQLQRVFLAKVIAQNPKLILLDEPTNHLDLKHQLEFIEYVKSWTDTENRVSIGVFHDISLALRFADNVLFLADGRVSRIGRFEETADRSFLKQLYGVDVARFMKESTELFNVIQ
jgi:iron complex transport system ATP-binding protein